MKLIVNDQLANYSDEGTGSVVVLLHGWGASLRTFDAMAKQLSDRFRVIRVDFPGFGQSPKPNSEWYVDNYALFVADFLHKLGVVGPYALIGHSFGGRVILKAVGRDYLSPKKVVLMGSAGVKPKLSAQKIMFISVAKVGKQIVKLPVINKFHDRLRRRLYETTGSTDYLEADAMRPIFLHTINEDLQSEAAKIMQPSLLIWGESDDETPVADGRILHHAIKNSKLIVILGAGHFVYVDKQDEVIKSIKDFL